MRSYGVGLSPVSPLKRSWIVWIAICVMAVMASALYWHISEPGRGALLIDFQKAYYAAGKAVLNNDPAALGALIADATFVNIPIVAWLFSPLALLGPHGAKLTFSILGLLAAGCASWLIAQRCRPNTRPIIFALFILNGPLWYSILIGNTTHFILLFMIVALLSLENNHPYRSGLLIGFSAIVKPMILLFGLYFLWRRNWRVVLGGATVAGGALLSSIGVFGLGFTLDWYRHMAAFAGNPMGAYNVQSLDAFILRLWSGATLARDWHAQALPFSAKIIRNILVGTLFILAALAVWRTRPTQECGDFKPVTGSDYLHYSLMIVLCVTVSTVSWTHYYLLMLLPWTLYISGRLPLIDDRLTHGLVWGSIVLCSIPVSFPQLEPEWLASLYSRSLASVWFFGGLLLFWAFLRSALIRSSETLTPWLPEIFVANAPSALEGAGRKA